MTRTAGAPSFCIAQARAGRPQTAARRSAEVAVRRNRRRTDAAIARPAGPGATKSAGRAARRTNGSGTRSAAPKKAKGPSKNRLSAQEKAERAVEAAEAALVELEGELADPAAWATRYEAAKSEARHTAAKRAVEAAYATLEELID